jgi:AraC-like DNA-binding protein
MNRFRMRTDVEEISLVEVNDINGVKPLPGAQRWQGRGCFGTSVFQQVSGDTFELWYSQYHIKQPVTIFGQADTPALELHISYKNKFRTQCKGLGELNMHERQYQLAYLPVVETETLFDAGIYETFDIHIAKENLCSYAPWCPRLQDFLVAVEKGTPSTLLPVVRFLSPAMEEVIRSMLSYDMQEELVVQYYKGKVQELLINMFYQVSLIDTMPRLSKADQQYAEEVRKIILDDFSIFESVERLARRIGIAEPRLQMAFKQLYGVTVGKFSKDARMKKAHELLSGSDDILLSVALAVGYNDIGNFATAFKKHFGYTPGSIQKQKRKFG